MLFNVTWDLDLELFGLVLDFCDVLVLNFRDAGTVAYQGDNVNGC